MATALNYLDYINGNAAAPRNDRADLSPNMPAVPTRYAIREIGFSMINGKLQFAFKSNDLAQNLPAGGIDEVVAGLLVPPPVMSASVFAAFAAPPAPTTPLDLDVAKGPIWLIYMLSEPGNMRFSAALKAMTHKEVKHRPFYGHLRHATAAGPSSRPLADCRLIYFAAAPPAGSYRHGFNINVELDQDPDSNGNPRVLPMEIDPDVRHPGGSET